MLTFDQASRELVHNGNVIGHAIRDQFQSQDPFATLLIEAYDKGKNGDADGQAAFCRAYDAWRTTNAVLVHDVALALEHPLPGSVPPEAPTPFAAPEAHTAPPAPVPTPSNAPPEAQPNGKRSRITWSHPEIAQLTRLLVAPPERDNPESAVSAFAAMTNGKFDREAILTKAVELGLIEASATAQAPQGPYKLTAHDKANLSVAVANLAPETLTPNVRLALLKFAAAEIRTRVKAIGE